MGWLSKIFKGSNHKVSEGRYDWRYGADTVENHPSSRYGADTVENHPSSIYGADTVENHPSSSLVLVFCSLSLDRSPVLLSSIRFPQHISITSLDI